MKRYLSPGTVLAALALFVALAGTAPAAANKVTALITGAQIKNGSIGPVDISPRAKRTLKGNRGARGVSGAQGQPGPAGAQGPQGLQGPQGPPGIQQITVVKATKTIAPGAIDFVQADCPSGMAFVSGGWTLISDYAITFYDFGNASAPGRYSWYVGIDNFGAPSSAEATAHANCSPNISVALPALTPAFNPDRLVAERRAMRQLASR